MKLIPLTRNKFAMVDDEDFIEISKFKWTAQEMSGLFYAIRTFKEKGKYISISMHKTILHGCKLIDHKNGNGLDNRRSNLRCATHSMNSRNKKPCGSSKYMGVSWHKPRRKWQSHININGKKRYLGTFDCEKIAAQAYIDAASKFGVLEYIRVKNI